MLLNFSKASGMHKIEGNEYWKLDEIDPKGYCVQVKTRGKYHQGIDFESPCKHR
jgi:hypothetical protein